ncbi:MAG: deoxyribose-phosphate aldolase [Opitutaceae bacterium]|jgi:deoxyribose-phosphate aldolase|nr:deoxyribose-phosphate aldolase [Opitutaceae bacterium]
MNIANITPNQLAAACDSTNLRLDATEADIEKLCAEAAEFRFACVMIYPASVPLASRALKGTGMKIGTVIGFPSGRFSTEAKAAEINAALKAGAHEVDIVMNYPALLAGHVAEVAGEVAELARLAHGNGQLIKVIVETCFLSEAQKLAALSVCEEAGADFIKTSTGFGTGGAKVADIEAWARNRRGSIQLKASGGIKTLADARALLAAGATRLGTSNAAAIVTELRGGARAVASAGY